MNTLSYKIVPRGKVYEVDCDVVYYRSSLPRAFHAVTLDAAKKGAKVKNIKSIKVVITYE